MAPSFIHTYPTCSTIGDRQVSLYCLLYPVSTTSYLYFSVILSEESMRGRFILRKSAFAHDIPVPKRLVTFWLIWVENAVLVSPPLPSNFIPFFGILNLVHYLTIPLRLLPWSKQNPDPDPGHLHSLSFCPEQKFNHTLLLFLTYHHLIHHVGLMLSPSIQWLIFTYSDLPFLGMLLLFPVSCAYLA